MGGPRDGRYYITSLLGLNYILGITADGNPGAPVVADGKGDIFTLEKLENGDYSVVFELPGGIPKFVQDNDGKVVGTKTPPPSPWTIAGKDCGPYTIQLPGDPNKGWVLDGYKEPSPVIIGTVNHEHINPVQYWNFVPVF